MVVGGLFTDTFPKVYVAKSNNTTKVGVLACRQLPNVYKEQDETQLWTAMCREAAMTQTHDVDDTMDIISMPNRLHLWLFKVNSKFVNINSSHHTWPHNPSLPGG